MSGSSSSSTDSQNEIDHEQRVNDYLNGTGDEGYIDYTAKTVTNPDGSKTTTSSLTGNTTTTELDGTVSTFNTYSGTATITSPNGSTTTSKRNSDGSYSTTLTSSNGSTVNLSSNTQKTSTAAMEIDANTIDLSNLSNSLTGLSNLSTTLEPGSYEVHDYLNSDITNASITVGEDGNSTITTTAKDGSTTTANTADNLSTITVDDSSGTTTTKFNPDGSTISASFVSKDGEDASLTMDVNNDGRLDNISVGLNNNGIVDSVLDAVGLGDEYQSSVTISTGKGNVITTFESDDVLGNGDLKSTIDAITSNLQASGSDIAGTIDDLDLDNLTSITTQEHTTTKSGNSATVTKEYGTGLDWDRVIPDTSVEISTANGTINMDYGFIGDLTGVVADKLFGATLSEQITDATIGQTLGDLTMDLFGGAIVESIAGAKVAGALTQFGVVGDVGTSMGLLGTGNLGSVGLGVYNLTNTLTDVSKQFGALDAVIGDTNTNNDFGDLSFNELSDASNNYSTKLEPVKEIPKEYAYTVSSVYSSIQSNYVGALQAYNVTLEEVNTSMVIQNIQQLRYEESRKVDLSGQDPYRNFAGGSSFSLGMAGSSYASLEPVSVGDILFDENTSKVDTEADLAVNKGKTRFSDAGGFTFIHSLYPEAFQSKLDLESIVNIDTKDRVFEVSMLQELKANKTEMDLKIADYNNEVNRISTLMPLLNDAIADYKAATEKASGMNIKYIESTVVANSKNNSLDLYQRVNPTFQAMQDKFDNTLSTSADINTALANRNYDLAETLINSISDIDYLKGISDITVTDDELLNKDANLTAEVTADKKDMTGWDLIAENVGTLTKG